ncbi:gametocyte-specific factor 1-like [Drosophila willistoni]|uniref:gametocyte-specific factor 1-like n=1 Tax=Drosophila willistoni TaxID=7260 RepID=UPI001F0719A4|nr:gametocyte-specific factor 1-like [Drosophila willistoni]
MAMSGNWVECPFNRFHRILPTRLVLHLNRCARNYSGLKMVRCPFDITHVVRIAEMEAHVPMCPSRKMEELGVDQCHAHQILPKRKRLTHHGMTSLMFLPIIQHFIAP